MVGGVVKGEFCVTNFGWFGAWRGSAEPWMGIGSTVTVRVGWRPLRRMRLRRCSMNFAHVPVVYARHLPIVPGDRDRIPTRFGDNAAITGVASPVHSGALLETLGFGDCHCHVAYSPFSGFESPLGICCFNQISSSRSSVCIVRRSASSSSVLSKP